MIRLGEIERSLVRRYEDDDVAFFLMAYEGEGALWPPEGDAITAVLDYLARLRIVYVNEAYARTYGFDGPGTPLGWTLDQVTGSMEAAVQILQTFYDIGGHSTGTFATFRQDGLPMWLRGEYHTIERDGLVVAHAGLEWDITTELVRPVAAMEN